MSTGDLVEVYLSPGKTLRAALWMLVLPLALFAAFFFLAGPVAGVTEEGLKLAAGVVGLLAGIGGNGLRRKLASPELPEVARVIEPAQDPELTGRRT